MKKVFLILFLSINLSAFSQGSGPHTFPLPPKDITAINLFYVNLGSNMTPSKDVILENGIIDIHAFAIPIVHSFSLKGQLAQVFVSPGFGNIGGVINVEDQSFDIVDKSGLLDANAMLRVGLINMPALNLEEYSKNELKFQLSALAGVTIPIGQYDQERRVNLGGNRWAFKLGMPMIVPLNNNKAKMFLWEIVPSITFFTRNNDPFVGKVKTQKPLLWIEQHFSKNFSSRFWASIDMGYQYGGKTHIDNESLDNKINQFAAGGTLGYTPVQSLPLNFQASFGRIWFNDTSGHMIRFGGNMAIPSKAERIRLKSLNENQ